MPARNAAAKPQSRQPRQASEGTVSLDQILSALDGMNVGDLRQIASSAEAKIRDKSDGEK